MFSGIVEAVAKVLSVKENGTNKTLEITNPYNEPLYIDQSISHNGVCLTVVKINEQSYEVDVVDETLKKSNIGKLQSGDQVNLERSLKLGSRIDGHFVQGHVDNIAPITEISEKDGSWLFQIKIPTESQDLIVPRGSISINGISLTIADISDDNIVTVAIIPYTYANTNLQSLKINDHVNIEYDMFGKYIQKYLQKIRT